MIGKNPDGAADLVRQQIVRAAVFLHWHLLASVFGPHKGMLEPAGDLGHRVTTQPFFDQVQHQVEHRARTTRRPSPSAAQDDRIAGLGLRKLGVEGSLIAPVDRNRMALHHTAADEGKDPAREGPKNHAAAVKAAHLRVGVSGVDKA